MTAAVTPVVHVPDEPEVQAERWLAAVLGGQRLDEVLCGTGGVSEWLWSRWRVLGTSGLDQRGLDAIVIGYRPRGVALAGRREDLGAMLFGADRSHQAPARRGRPRRGVNDQGRPSTVIWLRDVAVRRDGVTVLADIDWTVRKGDRWVVLGPNGSGKTTLLQVASGRLWPTTGSVEILGARLGGIDLRELRPRISLVSGSVIRQLRTDIPARQVVVSGLHGALETWWNHYRAEDWDRADSLLARGGVGHLGDRSFGVISEGERQQVLLARALMGDPELVLLDEPFAGLDLGARERLLTQLAALAADPQSPTMVLVTHHCEEIPPGFTHAALARRGMLVEAGPLHDVITSASISTCFDVTVVVGSTSGRWWSRAR